MPVVHIHMYKGRTKEQKKELVRRITKDFEEVVNVKPQSLHILFQDSTRKTGEPRVLWRRNCRELVRARYFRPRLP
jgi:4-oxalocrotonate tautomerase family enzyme